MLANKIKLFLFLFLFTNLFAFANDPIDKILIQSKNHSALTSYVLKKDLKRFEKKLKSQNNLGIRIFGDSHIAADFFPRVLRGYLIKSNSIGFAHALQPKYQQNLNLKYSYKNFEILNSKNPKNIKLNFPLGGIIAKAKDKNAKINIDTTLNKKKFEIGFLFKAKDDNNAFNIKDAQGKNFKLRSFQSNKWSYKKLEATFPLEITALQKNAELGGYFITNKNDNNFLDTVAINGAKSDIWLSWNPLVVKNELKLLHNDLIILSYGSNDALFQGFEKQKFKNNLKHWIEILKSYNKNTIIMLISPPIVTYKKNRTYELAPNFFAVREALYEVAKEEKTLIFDMYKFMQDTGGKDKWIKQKLSLKDVHLTIKGYDLMAKKMLEDLKQYIRY
ncbi:GDSL-type esterase/lipase family protein [Campylobacter molothri]|uniref:GDSL-type esterase/lipase family protein n=1 Tax=Campylobacter molothri TaxID=1032242 RepID=UPI001EFBDA72|nr:GDSL-type esterase/lipase family protein [Campylobacter sp. RM10537]MBZ7949915.1 hypothetical protein [Campylobacter sp. RM10534]ULN99558.1 putative periplasmic SGNH family hydrolase (SGNH_peri1 domain) [Campylobacter sp. RM10537]